MCRAPEQLHCQQCKRTFSSSEPYHDLTTTSGLQNLRSYRQSFWGGTEIFRCAAAVSPQRAISFVAAPATALRAHAETRVTSDQGDHFSSATAAMSRTLQYPRVRSFLIAMHTGGMHISYQKTVTTLFLPPESSSKLHI